MSSSRVVVSIRTQKGLTLVEIMVALTLSLLLMGGVGEIYLASKQTYLLQEAQSRLQETARYALEVLTHDIRLAGYFGCARTTSTTPVVLAQADDDHPLIAPNGVAPVVAAPVSGGNDNEGSFSNPNPVLWKALNNVIKGTDALTVLFGEFCGATTTAEIGGTDLTDKDINKSITAGNTCTIKDGDPVVIADCQIAHIFRAKGPNTGSINRPYAAGSEILPLRSYTYYIRSNPNNQPALYRFDNNNSTSVEIAEGLENMQILYGVDTDGDKSANRYLAANNVASWNQVVSVRVTLWIRSVSDNVLPSPQTYVYNGDTITNRRLRQVFTATVGLRNALP